MTDLHAWFSDDEISRLEPLLDKAEAEGWRSWVRTRADFRALLLGYYFDLRLARHFEDFCANHIRHVSGDHAGKPFLFLDWQKNDFFYPLFGWVRKENGKLRRRFKRGFVFIGKKNGKSTAAAAIALYLLCADGEMEAKCYVAANSREQAGEVWDKAAKFVEDSPTLSRILKIGRGLKKTIAHLPSKSFLRPISSEGRTNDGADSHLAIYDELHDARNDRLFSTIEHADLARSNALCPFVITTAGDDPSPENICYRQYTKAKKVVTGESDDVEFFALVYEAPADLDPGDPRAWHAANPSIGSLIQESKIAAKYKNAVETGSVANFRRRILNQWVSIDEERWVPRAKWDACKGSFPDDYRNLPCYLGVDLSKKSDFTALVRVWVDEPNSRYYVSPRFWLPSETYARRVRNGQTELLRWKDDEHLEIMQGPYIDSRIVEQVIRDECAINQVQAICFDERYADPIAQPLNEDHYPVIYVGQGIAHLSQPMKFVEGAILTRKIVHDGNNLMGWMFGNVVPARDRNDGIHPDKSRSVDRIDGVSALVTAFNRILVNTDTKSAYDAEEKDIVVFI